MATLWLWTVLPPHSSSSPRVATCFAGESFKIFMLSSISHLDNHVLLLQVWLCRLHEGTQRHCGGGKRVLCLRLQGDVSNKLQSCTSVLNFTMFFNDITFAGPQCCCFHRGRSLRKKNWVRIDLKMSPSEQKLILTIMSGEFSIDGSPGARASPTSQMESTSPMLEISLSATRMGTGEHWNTRKNDCNGDWGESYSNEQFFFCQGSTWQYLLMTATCLRSSSVLMSRYLRIILKVEYVKNDKIVIEIWSEIWCLIGFPLLRSEDHEWRLCGDSCKEQSSCSGPQHSLHRLIGPLGNSKTSDQKTEHWSEGIFVTYR